MKKINKKVIVIFSVILVVVIVGIVLKLTVFKEKFVKEEKLIDLMDIISIYDEKPTDQEILNKKVKYEELINSDEPIIENIEVEDDYASLWIVTEESQKEYILGYKGEKSVALLIKTVGLALGNEASVNDIYISDKSIKINFSTSGAPFNMNNVIGSDYLKVDEAFDKREFATAMFDSIAKTLKANYGEKMKIYYSLNDEDISIENISIAKDKPYEYLITN